MKTNFTLYNSIFKSHQTQSPVTTEYNNSSVSNIRYANAKKSSLNSAMRVDCNNLQTETKAYYKNNVIYNNQNLSVNFKSKTTLSKSSTLKLPKNFCESYNIYEFGNNNNLRGALGFISEFYKTLKESGIKTVICTDPNIKIKEMVEGNNLEFIELFSKNPMSGSRSVIFDDIAFAERNIAVYNLQRQYGEEYLKSHPELIDAIETKDRILIDNLLKSVQAVQNGNCFIGCTCGMHRTGIAIALINAFNPDGNKESNENLNRIEHAGIRNLYDKLTPADKEKIGLIKEAEKLFLQEFSYNNPWL